MQDNELETTKLERYLVNQGRATFIEEIRGASPETLDSKLLGLAKYNQEIENTRNDDKELRDAKQHARDLGASYREQLNMNKKLARFIALIMSERGVDLAPPAPPKKTEESDLPL